MSVESIKPPSTSDNSLAPSLSYIGSTKTVVKFVGSCLKQDKVTFTNGKKSKYTYCLWKNFMGSWIWWLFNARKLFGAVKLIKHADIDKYNYSGHGIGFDRCGTLSVGKNDSVKMW